MDAAAASLSRSSSGTQGGCLFLPPPGLVGGSVKRDPPYAPQTRQALTPLSDLDEMLAVMPQLGDGITDVVERQVRAALLEAFHDLRRPTCRPLLERRHVQIAVVEVGLELRPLPVEDRKSVV